MQAGCVVRSKLTFDSRAPRDMQQGELCYLYQVEDVAPGTFVFHFLSLEREKTYRIRLISYLPERWFEELT